MSRIHQAVFAAMPGRGGKVLAAAIIGALIGGVAVVKAQVEFQWWIGAVAGAALGLVSALVCLLVDSSTASANGQPPASLGRKAIKVVGTISLIVVLAVACSCLLMAFLPR